MGVITRTVRVIRTWEFTVEAEYGDNYQSLAAKVTEEQLDAAPPGYEERVVLEEHDSPVAKYSDLYPELKPIEAELKATRRGFLARLNEWAEAVKAEAEAAAETERVADGADDPPAKKARKA